MYAKPLPPDKNTTFIVSRLLYEKHVYNALDNQMRDVWGAHNVFCDIERGHRTVFGVFQKDTERFLGCVHGVFDDFIFWGHFLFKRKVDVVRAVLLCEEQCRQICKEKDIPLSAFAGMIPDSNRAAKIAASKLGYKDKGLIDGEYFYSFEQKIPCRLFKKEIK
jgi:hypothetical protein